MSTAKVLYVLTGPLAYEGMTMTALNFVRYIDRTKVQIDFAATKCTDGPIEEIENLGCAVHILGERLRQPVKYLFRLMKVIRRGGYNVVQAHGSSCTLAIELLAAFLCGVKVRIAHSHNTYSKFMNAHRLMRPFFELFRTHAFACGDEAGKWLFGRKPFTVVQNATDSKKFMFDPAVRRSMRAKLGIRNELVLGAVSKMNSQKNHGFMLDMFAELRKVRSDVKLVLVGDGKLREDIVNKAEELGLVEDVLMLGTRTDIPQLLQAFDVMLLPSLFEGFPCVMVEWQCAGLRALVSDRVTRDADLAGLVTYLPIDRGVEPWVEALRDFRQDSDRVMTGANAIMRVRAKGFDIVKTSRELEKFYIDSVKRGK